MTPKPKVSSADIPREWVDLVREIVQRDGRALRGPAERATIEVKSLRTNQWEPLMLWSSVMEFETTEDRDQILHLITG
jgi:hypothetical protein